MKTYIGDRLKEGCEVYVIQNGKRYPLPRFEEIANHSPDGFEWGYGGSGPAQLALAILADCLGPLPPPEKCPCCNSKMDGWLCSESQCGYDGYRDRWEHIQGGLVHYQNFKFAKIAPLKSDTWAITDEEIREWIEKNAKPPIAA
jgi:hypothetical protein